MKSTTTLVATKLLKNTYLAQQILALKIIQQ